MTLEGEAIGYFLLGGVISVADKLTADAVKGTRQHAKQQKEMYKALDFVLGTYEKSNWENLKKDPEFVDAFVKTREYFANRAEQPTLDSKVKEESKIYDSRSTFRKGFDYVKSTFTAEYWKNEKINHLSFGKKAIVAFAIPLYRAGSYMYDVIVKGVSSITEFPAQTVNFAVGGGSMLGGMYGGKLVNKGIDHYRNKYARKLARTEKKILMNEELKTALAEDISTSIPGLQIKKAEPKQEPKKEEPAKNEPKEDRPLTHEEILNKFKSM
jgi:hypothetical protein